MKERILIVIKDERLLEESASVLYDHDYLVTKASNLPEMESQINALPQDLILIDSTLWIKERPDLLSGLEQNYSQASIIHLLSTEDQETLEHFSSNGAGSYLFQPVTAKEILLMVDQAVRYKELMQRYQQMRNEFLEANKNLSNKTKEFQELLVFNTNILESINVGIITIDTDYKITSWNPKMGMITGIDPSAAIGSIIFDILPWLNSEKISERSRAVITQGKVTELGHLRGQRQDGTEVYADYKISPIKKGQEILGAVITVDDITQKLHIKEELDSSQRYISNLVEHSADAIISYDLDGTILTWNQGAQEIFGYSSQEAIGHAWDFLSTDKERKKINNMFQWVKKSGSVSNFETRMISKSGGSVPISMTISIIKDTEDKIYGLSSISKDLSEKRQIKKQFIQSQKMISLGAMAAGVAHNINNPLASLSANNALLMEQTQISSRLELSDYLGKIEADADRIAQMVKNLLWYAEPSEQILEMVDTHEILDKSILFASFQSNMHDIEIKKGYLAQQSQVMGNSRELIQAFVNLFTNAVAAMPDGGIITVQTESLKQEGLLGGQACICIKITDTGMGIPDENLPHIFKPFFTTRADAKGNGLGLYVVDSIIENHQGRIDCESEADHGTCFSICLPVSAETQKQEEG